MQPQVPYSPIKRQIPGYAQGCGIAALVLAIVGFVIPIAGVLFITPLAIIFGAIALYGGAKGMGIATLIIVAVNLIISPTFWLNVGAGAQFAQASGNRFLTWFDIIGVIVMLFLAIRSPEKIDTAHPIAPANIPEHLGIEAPSNMQANNLLIAPANSTEQPGNRQSSVTGLAQQIQQWFIKKDVPGWMRNHALLLSALGGVVVVLLIGYYAFIKPSPSADGKRAALAYTDCQAVYKTKVDSAYQSFLSSFAGQNNQTRANAEQKLESLLAGERQVYNTCNEAADKQYNELTARYADDSAGLAKFSDAFTENNGGSMSTYEIEESSSLLATVNERLQSIRAPFPDSSRIVKDLVGQRMDGWNFSYASEFKDVKIITQKLDGDMLILRTHLNLEDYITKEPFFAVLDLKYNLNSNGEWDYDGITQLLHNKANVNYFIGNEIFLVGKWRWQANYATYNSDGTWFGKQDNGGDMTGTWRIVKGNLVLTLNGHNWVNKKIVQFSKNELIIDEDTPARAERVE